jgi:hypothetical protein
MTRTGRTHRSDRAGLGFGATTIAVTMLVASPVGAGCGRSKEARGETTDPETPAATVQAADKFSEAAFELTIRAVGEYRAGQVGHFEVVLSARDPYHVNAEFPLTFKPRPGASVKYARDVVGKDMAKLETKRAIVPVEFTPQNAGRQTVAGTLRFSVCNDQRCLVDKRTLEIGIDVK